MSDEPHKFSIEEVDAVARPKQARVSDASLPDGETGDETDSEAIDEAVDETMGEKLERKRDYLDGFLNQKPAETPASEPCGALYDEVIATLKSIYDPEIPVNIYDLGLIYGVEVLENGHVVVNMTLTTPHCPVAESMPGEIELQVGSVPGVSFAEVNLVWDPPWDPMKVSDEARLELGML